MAASATQEPSISTSYGYSHSFDSDEIEEIDRYRPGGLHPIVLGDKLADGRFEVVHKLGHGGYATVWLCRDMLKNQWVALKVVVASQSEKDAALPSEIAIMSHFKNLGITPEELDKNHISVPSEWLFIRGPNGLHVCFLLPILGQSLRGVQNMYASRPDVLREICAQLVEAMAFLHGKGICHGDFRPQNILFKIDIEGLHDLSREEILSMFAEPREVEVPPIPTTGEGPGPHPPKFLYSSEPIWLPPKDRSTKILICDFGEAYDATQPRSFIAIPLDYAAPEVTLECGSGFSTDVWALAATICEVRQGQPPFDGDGIVRYVQRIEDILGPLPEPYRSFWIEDGHIGRVWLSSGSEMPATLPISETQEQLAILRETRAKRSGYADFLETLVREKNRRNIRISNDELVEDSSEGVVSHGLRCIEHQIPEQEADQLLDLLKSVFRYPQNERLTITEVLAHPWFSGFVKPSASPVGISLVEEATDEMTLSEPALDEVIQAVPRYEPVHPIMTGAEEENHMVAAMDHCQKVAAMRGSAIDTGSQPVVASAGFQGPKFVQTFIVPALFKTVDWFRFIC